MTADVFTFNAPKRFTPTGYEGRRSPPVYLLAPASYRLRAQFRAAVAAASIRYPNDGEIARVGLDVLDQVASENRDELKAIVQAFVDLVAAPMVTPPAEGATEEERQAFLEEVNRRTVVTASYGVVLDVLQRHPRVAQLMSERVMFGEMAGLLAAGIGLTGWENGPGQFRRQLGVVPDHVLAMLPEDDLVAIGNEVMAMLAKLGAAPVEAAARIDTPVDSPTPAAPPAEAVPVADLAKARTTRRRKAKPA